MGKKLPTLPILDFQLTSNLNFIVHDEIIWWYLGVVRRKSGWLENCMFGSHLVCPSLSKTLNPSISPCGYWLASVFSNKEGVCGWMGLTVKCFGRSRKVVKCCIVYVIHHVFFFFCNPIHGKITSEHFFFKTITTCHNSFIFLLLLILSKLTIKCLVLVRF